MAIVDRVLGLLIADWTPEQRRFAVTAGWRLVLTFHIAWACGWLAALGFPLVGFAQESDVAQVKLELSQQIEAVKREVADVSRAVSTSQKHSQRAAMETELRRLDQEIFNIDARLQELSVAGLRADRIYSERLSDLRTQKETISRRLRVFLEANPQIADGLYP